MQQSNAAELNSETSLNCNGKEFKCVNQTHFQLCSPSGVGDEKLTTIDGVIETCIAGQKCDDLSPTSCGVKQPSNRKHQLKGALIKRPAQRIRLIKGNRASNWRPRLSLKTDKDREYAAKLRERLIKKRRKQEIFIDNVLAKQNGSPPPKKKQNQKKNQKKDQKQTQNAAQMNTGSGEQVNVDLNINADTDSTSGK